MSWRPCFFCTLAAEARTLSAANTHCRCIRCGDYKITTEAEAFVDQAQLSHEQVANISGYIRENPGLTIKEKDLKFLRNLRTPTVAEKATRALIEFAKEYPIPGTTISSEFHALEGVILRSKAMLADNQFTENGIDKEYLAVIRMAGVCSARTSDELYYVADEYLKDQGLATGFATGSLKISPAGWEHLESLRRGAIESDKAFVAMSFREELGELFQAGLEPGIRGAGYDAVRVDRIEHNNRIDDEIVARIRQCKFLVADFTIDRGGIYFEAGYAIGLGRPVIWTVRHDQLEKVHFDNRQYNFIRWWPDKLTDLASALRNRIEATIGRGSRP
jgi:nucleoside 2-deoxyribosyltransferase